MNRLPGQLAFKNVGGVYVWLAIIAIFTVWLPHTFPTATTAKQVLNSNAVIGLLALSLIVPLSAGVFDISVAYTASLTGVVVAKCIVASIPLAPAIMIALAAGLLVGVVNAIVVVLMRVESLIATLATGSLILALISMVTDNVAITGPELAGSFAKIGQTTIAGLTLPVIYLLIVAVVLWFVLESTATGRRFYAAGFNDQAARLAGVSVDRLRVVSLLTSALIASIAGIVLASVLASGSPTAGTPYLLAAFAAAFLGATQLRGGRFNSPGTLIAILLLGTGITGLGLAAAPPWSADMFTGVVLIAALAATKAQRRRRRLGRVPRLRRAVGHSSAEPTVHSP